MDAGKRLATACVMLCLAGLAAGRAEAGIIDVATHFIVLTDLGQGVVPQSINNLGQVVGQSASGEAFLWDQGQTTLLGTLGGAESLANDINDHGLVVGWSYDGSGLKKAAKWENGLITNLDSVSSLESEANAVNVHNRIVGWKTDGVTFRSTIWDIANPDGLIAFSIGSHKALGINDLGKIVGVVLDENNDFDAGYYWNGIDPISGFSGGLGQDYFPIAGVNNDDRTAGAMGIEAARMFIGDSNTQTLGKILPTDPISIALDLNDTGLIVGESGEKGFAFDLTTGILHNLNDFLLMGFEVDSILRLTGVNDDGTFVGVARLDGVEHGIMGSFVFVPEPTTEALGLLALLCFAGFVARHCRAPKGRAA